MNEEREVKIEPSWKAMLRAEFGEEYFKQLRQFVKGEYQNAIVYPAPQDIFRAFELTPSVKAEVVIESAHPSPFSASSGFFGSKPFSKTNEYLKEHNKKPIDWFYVIFSIYGGEFGTHKKSTRCRGVGQEFSIDATRYW